MTTGSLLRPALFRFVSELNANNNRDWFQTNKERYISDVKEPALRFVVAFGQHLHRISPHFMADPRPSGGSLFRIYRDIRFSKDKSPYKDHVGLHFRHEAGKTAHTPGFYLHLQPRNCFAGAGIWRPDTEIAHRIRTPIAADAKGWRKITGATALRRHFERHGEQLKRPPRGFARDHPLVEELMYKDWLVVASLTQKQITGRDFPAELGRIFARTGPFVEFLCRALGQKF